MASFTIYDPKTKAFRVLETADTIDLPFEQVLLINILIELKVANERLALFDTDPPMDINDGIRSEIVQELG